MPASGIDNCKSKAGDRPSSSQVKERLEMVLNNSKVT